MTQNFMRFFRRTGRKAKPRTFQTAKEPVEKHRLESYVACPVVFAKGELLPG